MCKTGKGIQSIAWSAAEGSDVLHGLAANSAGCRDNGGFCRAIFLAPGSRPYDAWKNGLVGKLEG